MLAKGRLFGDVVIAALISAAATAPVAGYVAYATHTEAMARIEVDGTKQSGEILIAQRRLAFEQRQAACANALMFLEDEKTNPALPPAETQLLLADMRHTASSCVGGTDVGSLATPRASSQPASAR
ncbi:hypothetical protein [Sphingomonas sp. CROZ-RG-20F-R02-07]|uniref:hypothetical protein n=1 Tax=Sphingomonas sp. CROZ-RG-20F-R02-07 TaxID=2914832 RepID=UPI001F5605A2|nr:hypothetical protein [Sphingomonas sp. CROZ-RG-20F-R02-07]